jgi:hypothetical protein
MGWDKRPERANYFSPGQRPGLIECSEQTTQPECGLKKYPALRRNVLQWFENVVTIKSCDAIAR